MTAPAGDPTSRLFLPPPRGPAVPLRYRSGRLTAWDITTGENTVVIDGVEFANLPMLPGAWLSVVVVGDVLSLISTTDEAGITTYAAFGVPVTPPDPRVGPASRAAGYGRQVMGIGTLNTSTTSASYGDIGGVSALRVFKVSDDSAVQVDMSGSAYAAANTAGVAFGVQVDGGTTYDCFRNLVANAMLSSHTPWAGGNLITGLTAGEHTFQPQWFRVSGAGTPTMDSGDQLLTTIREIL